MTRDLTDSKRRVDRLRAALVRVLHDNETHIAGLRAAWARSSGLSAQGVELALSHALETDATDDEVLQLCASVPAARRVWAVLSANVFTSAFRAIALALASSPRVFVRASRRDPLLTDALHRYAPDLFKLVADIAPVPGDSVHAYGSDKTLATIQGRLTSGVSYFPHGSGMGVVLLGSKDDLALAAERIALDVTMFDQRGCLSPRLIALDSQVDRMAFARALASQLEQCEARVPKGALSAADEADLKWFREVSAYSGEVLPAGRGLVAAFAPAENIPIPPALRCVSLVTAPDVVRAFAPFVTSITNIGVDDPTLAGRARQIFADARLSRFGLMQRPRLDGPVDRRTREVRID